MEIFNESCILTAKQFASRHPRADAGVYFAWC